MTCDYCGGLDFCREQHVPPCSSCLFEVREALGKELIEAVRASMLHESDYIKVESPAPAKPVQAPMPKRKGRHGGVIV